jgi:hypothetical protein
MNKLTSALHDATHQVPGVPAHGENQANPQPVSRRSNGHPQPQSADRHQRVNQRNQRPPRVLIAWQNWIAAHIGGRNHQ